MSTFARWSNICFPRICKNFSIFNNADSNFIRTALNTQ